ncbi:MAG: YbaY family lipoprotein [Planctomycetaceae bacterium]
MHATRLLCTVIADRRVMLGAVAAALCLPASAQGVPVAADPAAGARYLPPAQVQPGRYVLGINVRNTPTGVEIAGVNPGGAGQRSGLEAGDVIVAVEGIQVGYVGGRLNDLGDEIARRVDGAGRVTLLVRNRRDGGLVQVPIQFNQAVSRAVTGRIFVAPGVAVPGSAVVTIRVLDVTQPQWQHVAVVQGQAAVTALPFPYRLDLPPLPPNHRYAIDARIEDRGRVLAQTPAAAMLAAVDRDQQADLTLTAAGAGPVVVPSVGGTPGLAPRDQIERWVQTYLGRPSRPFEVDIWLVTLQRGRSLTDVQAGILSSSELFERQGRSRDLYVTEVFRLLYGGPPNPAQLSDLRARYDRAFGVRQRFVEDLLKQPR